MDDLATTPEARNHSAGNVLILVLMDDLATSSGGSC